MHISVWTLHVLFEFLLLLLIQRCLDLVVRLVAKWPYPGETILA
jgi:hypothetical protein